MDLIDSGLQETNELEQSVLELEQSVLVNKEDRDYLLTQQPIEEGNELEDIIDNPL